MTVSEVACVGVAALFVPFPFAVDDHQTTNAKFLSEADAAWLKQQEELSVNWLADWLRNLDRETCLACALRAHSLAKPDAAAAVVSIMQEVSRTR